jgi:hypothetical protein
MVRVGGSGKKFSETGKLDGGVQTTLLIVERAHYPAR